eukprot:gene7134-1760_t
MKKALADLGTSTHHLPPNPLVQGLGDVVEDAEHQ